MTTCPDPGRLEQLLNNRLVDTELDELVQHVEGCSACQQVLELLTESTVWEPRQQRGGDPGHIRAAGDAVGADSSDGRQFRVLQPDECGLRAVVGAPYTKRGHEVALKHMLEAHAEEPIEAGDGLQWLRGYRIEHELGRGGMGIVYRAFDEKRGMAVALKILKRPDATAILRFKQEFRALADVSHPNLVALYELATEGPIWFFTMELIEGVDFRHFVRSGTDPPAPFPETTEYLGPPSTSLPGDLGSAQDAVGDTGPFDPKWVVAGHGVPPNRGYSLSPAALARLQNRPLATGRGDRRPP